MSESSKIIHILKRGGIGVLPTDTLYGVVGSALKPEAVERIYELRKRSQDKPMIVLISGYADLNLFGIELESSIKDVLKKYWPGPLSVIFKCASKKFEYLHRGKKSLAIRLPQGETLQKILKKTGPLVAPSANLEGQPPAETIDEAEKYFGNKVDFYNDGDRLQSKPSTLAEIKNGRLKVLREGAVKVND